MKVFPLIPNRNVGPAVVHFGFAESFRWEWECCGGENQRVSDYKKRGQKESFNRKPCLMRSLERWVVGLHG